MGLRADYLLNSCKILMMILLIYTLSWVGVIFYYSQLKTVGISIVLLVMGAATGGFISMLWSYVQERTSTQALGQVSGMMNPAPFLGIAFFQVLTAAILDRSDRMGDLYGISGYQNAFMACLAGIVICFGLSFFLKKPSPSEA